VGSDAAALIASARLDGDHYVLNGRKQWCTNGSFAGVTMAMFRTGGRGSKGISAFLVDNDTPGVVVE
jgi:alkylation response protein AidB-like acyl-CoA dehydrogenase